MKIVYIRSFVLISVVTIAVIGALCFGESYDNSSGEEEFNREVLELLFYATANTSGGLSYYYDEVLLKLMRMDPELFFKVASNYPEEFRFWYNHLDFSHFRSYYPAQYKRYTSEKANILKELSNVRLEGTPKKLLDEFIKYFEKMEIPKMWEY